MTIEEANRYLKEVYLPRHNAQFSVPAKEASKTAYTPWLRSQSLDEILCIQEERTVQNDNTVSYRNLRLQIPHDDLRHHYVKTVVQVRSYLDGTLGLFYGPRCLGYYTSVGHLITESKQCVA